MNQLIGYPLLDKVILILVGFVHSEDPTLQVVLVLVVELGGREYCLEEIFYQLGSEFKTVFLLLDHVI